MKNKKILTLALIIISTIGVLELKNGNIKESYNTKSLEKTLSKSLNNKENSSEFSFYFCAQTYFFEPEPYNLYWHRLLYSLYFLGFLL